MFPIYWLVRGRQYIRNLIHSCVTCRRLEGRPYKCVPLPDFRVNQSRPFQNSCVDFAGPMYVKGSDNPKVWLCLYTCCATRAVHLEVVPDLNATTFLRSFRRFTSRRGVPNNVVSDSAKIFKAASRRIREIITDYEVQKHLSDLNVKWMFNLEKAPWWGGFFERLIGCAKRCLKKTIGKASLTYDELVTVVTEVEVVLNSSPLTYINADNLEELLTPSHLMFGYRVLSLPNAANVDKEDPDYENLTRRMKYVVSVSEQFWKRWRTEYLQELRELHRVQLQRSNSRHVNPISEGKIVIVFEEGAPRHS